MPVTGGKLYFIELSTRERLEIQFVPKTLNISRTPNIANIQVVGWNTPKYQYTGGETTLEMQLDFFAEDEDRKDVFTKCRWLESLTYNDGFLTPPSKIQLIFGDMFRKEKWIVKSCNYKMDLFHKEEGYLPQQAYVDLVLGLDPDQNLKIRDIRNPFPARTFSTFNNGQF